MFVNDHIIVDGSPRSAAWTNTYDPLIALSFIAAHTSRIRLGTSVLIMPYRNPIATAKMLASLDQMSGGRVIAGVGVGWNEAEFNALGVPFHERGARTDEYLRLWQACWAPGEVSFAGEFFTFANMHVSPKPLQQPHPPIWIGGSSRAALRRAAAFARSGSQRPRPWRSCANGKRIYARPVSRPAVKTSANTHELSDQLQQDYGQQRTVGSATANRPGYASTGGGRPPALPTGGRGGVFRLTSMAVRTSGSF